MSRSETGGRTAYADRALRVAILAGVAIAVGLVALVIVGLAARIGGISVWSLMQLLLIGVLLWPVYRLAPWQAGVAGRVRGWIRSNRFPIALTALLLAGSRLPVAPKLFFTLVNLPLVRTAGFFFGAELFYRPHVGFELGQFVRRFGQWYVTVFFLLAVSVVLVDVGASLRSAVGDRR